jgi:hypothetical protein
MATNPDCMALARAAVCVSALQSSMGRFRTQKSCKINVGFRACVITQGISLTC